jgi:protein-tyrosine phosphatase
MEAIGITAPAAAPVVITERRPWMAAAGYMLALSAFFFLSYGLANWTTNQRSYVPSLVFGWEHSIPFLAWTIVPYWSLDLFYCMSFFVCRTREELDRHVTRLVTAQIIAVSVFMFMPLRFTFERPETNGFFGWMFTALTSFDKPFNQAPSLHLSLAVILAAKYSAYLKGFERRLLQALFVVIGASALTTYQHHFIDIATGLWLGALCCALVPEESGIQDEAHQERHPALSSLYVTGSFILAAAAARMGGWAWWLLWPSGACLILAGIYWTGRPMLFRKRNGSLPSTMLWLLAPYVAAAWLNSRWWTRRDPAACEIAPGVWIGRLPSSAEIKVLPVGSIVDLTAELPLRVGDARYRHVPVLDLTVPTVGQLDAAVALIDSFETDRPTLVCCALGYSRSAAAAAAWLVAKGRASSVDAAIASIQERRRKVVLTEAHRARLATWAQERGHL